MNRRGRTTGPKDIKARSKPMKSYLLLNKREGMKVANLPQANLRQAQKPRRAVRPKKKIAVAHASGADAGDAAVDAVASRSAKNEAASGRRKNRLKALQAKLLNPPKANPPLRSALMWRLSLSVRVAVGKMRRSCCRESRSPSISRREPSRPKHQRLSRGRMP